MAKVTYVQGDDWEGVYIDGKLEIEGHSIDFREVLDKMGVQVESISADCNWLHERGRLPDNLSEVKV